MESALVVTHSEKSMAFFTEILGAASIGQITSLRTCGDARRLLLERDFDLVVINAPLRDESGEALARSIAQRAGTQVLLVVGTEHFDAICAVCEADGILVIAKPVTYSVVWSALKLAGAAQNRMKRMQAENSRLKQKLEDIRIVDRAKCILISYLNMSEQDAHHFIEKQAMDMRLPKRAIAEGILKTYEN